MFLFCIQTFKTNVIEMEIPGIDCVQCNVLSDLSDSKWMGTFDTVIMNPPFGTKKNAGIDMKFLEVGIKLAKTAVYSLHKTSTRFVFILFFLIHQNHLFLFNLHKN